MGLAQNWYAPFMEDSEIKNTVNHEGSIVMSKNRKIKLEESAMRS